MITTLEARNTLLNVARGHTWVEEQGANRGQAVEAILKRVSLAPGQPWCAAFVSYIGWLVLRERWPLKLVGGCATLAEDALAKGLFSRQPAAGRIFLLFSEKHHRFNHTGFLWEQSPAGAWKTIEGNTNAGGSPEGTGVFVRERAFDPKDRFIEWCVTDRDLAA